MEVGLAPELFCLSFLLKQSRLRFQTRSLLSSEDMEPMVSRLTNEINSAIEKHLSSDPFFHELRPLRTAHCKKSGKKIDFETADIARTIQHSRTC